MNNFVLQKWKYYDIIYILCIVRMSESVFLLIAIDIAGILDANI